MSFSRNKTHTSIGKLQYAHLVLCHDAVIPYFFSEKKFPTAFQRKRKANTHHFWGVRKIYPKKKLLLLVCCNPTLGGIKHLQIQRAGFLLKWDVEKLETKFCAIRDKSNDPTKARQKQPFYPIKHRLIVSKGRNSGGSSRWIKQKKTEILADSDVAETLLGGSSQDLWVVRITPPNLKAIWKGSHNPT